MLIKLARLTGTDMFHKVVPHADAGLAVETLLACRHEYLDGNTQAADNRRDLALDSHGRLLTKSCSSKAKVIYSITKSGYTV